MQFEEIATWIASINVRYHVGVDGLSIPFVWLTTLLTTLSLFYSKFNIKDRVREFFFMFLLLETGMIGVFVSLDFFLFYVFWELGLVPMYFLIAIWGHAEDRPQYSAIKFFLYTLAGSVFMLLGIIALYINTSTPNNPGTFD
ncbi:MAG: NADH-quinone oxidoreductase subunit M, partial [Chloroflexi bacterium]|nr:NADH-quinone oxidoreductase subunit M [Chloroflexota bacterium]